MLAKKITYTDFDGIERTETFRFNLTKSELLDMELSKSGGFSAMLQEIVDSKNTEEIMKLFKEIILSSYGEKSDDGRYFKKSPEIAEQFSQSAAFDALYLELMTDAGKAADFIRDIMSDPEAKEAVEKSRIEAGVDDTPPQTIHVVPTNKYADTK